MSRDRGAGDLSWVFNAYVIAFGGLLLLGGRLSDLLGARRVFAAGWSPSPPDPRTRDHGSGGDPCHRRISMMGATMRIAGPILLAAGGILGAALWWRKHPSACPYGQRFWVEPPHPLITRPRLREILAPAPGERLLEVGPGTGYYSLHVAGWIGPAGRLDVFDLQQDMLDHTMRRAREAGLENIVPAQGDARSLPYDDATFDGAYLTAVLGEIPDQDAALRELARVLKPGGRLVVGELFGDPHWVSPHKLRERAERAGLTFASRLGSPLGYFSRFQRDERELRRRAA